MNERTMALLATLDAAPWVASVGKPVPESADVARVMSWQEAIGSPAYREWDHVVEEASDRFAVEVQLSSGERFGLWNELVRMLKVAAYPIVRRRVEASGVEVNIARELIRDCNWVVLHACLECEYADLVPPGFFCQVAEWYVRGHYPCGWEGAYPDGRLIVF